ncbi:thioredoxin domain-containing protein [Flavobacterium silvaticum]|uniref:Thioredoxin domain-containing protein n=1 Tax=Flavobacterium silvaticum TaxID=1852020 RepID=A0A972FPP2_9FLAO|nr:thioredoxin domain-containing protein [Flavobacterium silvaticum]NMH27124.1 thioredoxin domain-containing protein [Flavobacterium silvaticum]
MNELAHETSPYLLQHAQNPVHWKAWNPASLELAKSQNKLIIISVGYAACHWCHVMEHETFEDEEAAVVMNEHFVCIKVDREERPDVDAVYMKAVQLMTRHGGWPMNVIALPDGRPVWGGTYFRKHEWMESLQSLQDLYESDKEKMEDYAQKLHEGIVASNLLPPASTDEIAYKIILENLVAKWSKSFDPDFGGYARAPKFMLPNNWEFLLAYGHKFQNAEILDHVFLTLDKMAMGGIFDTVGGGFSRYSVDMKWHVPHFEKMLYDNAQLISLYSKAYQLTSEPLYLEIVQKTIAFAQRELLGEKGNFYASLDADSINPQGKLEEGAFYVWTKKELSNLLGKDFGLFSQVFNITDFGHWEHGNYVLIRTEPYEAIAAKSNLRLPELLLKINQWETTLFNARKNRPVPRLDNKSITSWNALMITGLCDAYKATSTESWLDLAKQTALFINTFCRDANGLLSHTSSENGNQKPGFLEDYAFCCQAFISLYEISFDEKWLLEARQLLDHCLDAFFDTEHGFFKFNDTSGENLIADHFEMEDNVIPASNSVLAKMLHVLGRYFDNPAYLKLSDQMISSVVPVADYASAFSNWLSVALLKELEPLEVIVCGKNAREFLKPVFAEYLPDVLIAATENPSELPLFRNRFVSGKTVAYICRGKTCSLPVENPQEILNLLLQTD